MNEYDLSKRDDSRHESRCSGRYKGGMLMDFDCHNLLAYKAGQVTCV
ncbi:hypothetical protein KPSA1_06882 [Pseudomonas syringae pv. actinidiae]|uniref:Uncharacterized protein n=1 Tax=Pseudomonas syringae pv. actinidiae TaxID=103796 RepID=A0A2V0QKH1_PSESF|nr:hypothetical protein KPSA1_06882 [Pseudomonas syringae pv. actinidiae]